MSLPRLQARLERLRQRDLDVGVFSGLAWGVVAAVAVVLAAAWADLVLDLSPRLRLAAVAAGIAVSFVTDAGAVVSLPAAGHGVAIEQQQDGGMLWAEARWNSQ